MTARALMAALLLALPISALAACDHALTIGVSQLGYSYFIGKNGKPAGAVPDLASELSRRSGCTLAAWFAQQNLRLGMVRGSFMGAQLDAKVAEYRALKRLDEATDYDNLADRLNLGRVQGALFPSMVYRQLQDEGRLDKHVRVIAITELTPTPLGMYFNLQRISASDRATLIGALREMLRDGTVQRTYARYLGAATAARLFAAASRP
ncbi:MAG TPA: hypothetical protein VGE47_08680 [Burkholderiaceae bacterium]